MGIATIKYRKLTFDDKEAIEALLNQNSEAFSSSSWQTFLYEQEYYDPHYAFWDDCLIGEPVLGDDEAWCCCPIGTFENSRRVCKKIYQYFNRKAMGVVFTGVDADGLELLRADYGDLIRVTDKREAYCYILSAKEQIELQGSKFSDRRRRIRRFSDTYQWTYVELTSENLSEIALLNKHWYDSHDQAADGIEGEQDSIRFTLENYDTLCMQGGMLYVDGKVVAFCMGHPGRNGVYQMTFQKALTEYRDAIQLLLHEFFSRHCVGFEYISESSDMGLDGLRFFKMQLRPVMLLERYDVHIAPTRRYTLKKLLRPAYRRLRAMLNKLSAATAEQHCQEKGSGR